MGYDHLRLFLQTEQLIREKPARRLDEIADLLHVERHTIARLIRLYLDKSFRDYRKELLLARAKKLLKKPNLSVKQVAVSLGYNHPRDFSRFFRSMTGATPTEFRSPAAKRREAGQAIPARHRRRRGH